MDETVTSDYTDHFGVPLSPTPLRAVSVNIAKALMEIFPIRHVNNTALLSDVKRMRIDSTTLAADAAGLRLTVAEYRRFRVEDAETIKRLGVKAKNLEAAARHEIEVA